MVELTLTPGKLEPLERPRLVGLDKVRDRPGVHGRRNASRGKVVRSVTLYVDNYHLGHTDEAGSMGR